jgi:hypothetical protein
MAKTQKTYLGDTLIGKKYFGNDLIIERGAIPLILDIELLVVAGGGGGGENYTDFTPWSVGGGGGAGGMITGSFTAEVSDSFTTSVGNGGNGGNASTSVTNGQNSSFIGSGLSITAYGGGYGGNPRNPGEEDGNNGGSGGGASRASGTAYSAGTATIGSFPAGFSGFGNNGGGTTICGGGTYAGGGGGGAGSAGSSNNCNVIAGSGTSWVDGITYARGGGSGTTATANSGNGGNPSSTIGQSGQKGIVKLRYTGTPKATGGTITQDGGYTYHTFTSGGTFTVTG